MASRRTKIEFPGSDNLTIAALLESPENKPRAFALFAHCFTCGKDVVSAARIARNLLNLGYAVLRFDFTGLGSSEGDFANSNFSTNVQDLVAAADFLRDSYIAPSLLIGHSLGGAAVLAAAEKVPEAVGIVTIGAPADPQHVVKQFACDIDAIERDGVAKVSLAGRDFTIKKQFLDDLDGHQQQNKIANLNKALLVLHSPLDATVAISEAEKIYKSAKHPKSFISLDKADHLLTNARDAEYVATTIAAWASRFIDEKFSLQSPTAPAASGKVQVLEKNRQFLRRVNTDQHSWLADEPVSVGGSDLGPDPYEHLLAALGTCTSMTIRMYANRKQWPLTNVTVELQHNREHRTDCEGCDSAPMKLDVLQKSIQLEGDLSEEQRERLVEIGSRCPVHQTLVGKLEIRSSLVDKR